MRQYFLRLKQTIEANFLKSKKSLSVLRIYLKDITIKKKSLLLTN